VERSLKVLDGAVVVFDSVGGVEPQSETVWRQADRYKVPRIAFVNKMDKIGADFFKVVGQIRERLSSNPVYVQIPIIENDLVAGIIDLVEMKYAVWNDETLGSEYSLIDIPADYSGLAEEGRERLFEALSDVDEDLMEQYLEGSDISKEKIKEVLRKGAIELQIVPVFSGSAFKNKGVQLLLDAIVEYLPCPLDVPEISGINPDTNEQETRPADPGAAFSSLAFKIMTDPYVGQLTYIRVYSGKLSSGSTVYNSSSTTRERIGRLLRMHANKREEVTEVVAGDIAAAVGLKSSVTGDTLCDEKNKIILESLNFPEPVISIAIEPKTKSDQEKLGMSLSKLATEDPSFKVRYDEETGQTIISGMGELHLEIIVDRLKREFNVDANIGKPQVAYKETIRSSVDVENKFIRQSGGRGQYGHVKIKVDPQQRGAGFEFVDEIKGGTIPKEYIPAVEKGLLEAIETGVVAGYPMVDLKVTLYDGSYHEVDSSEIAFKIAASLALKDAVRKAGGNILEPIMNVEVVVPEDHMGAVIGDLSSRRGKVSGTELRGPLQAVKSEVPLSEMFGYATNLRSITEGRGTFTMEFSHYSVLPDMLSEELKAKAV
jgi:elongation factor G